MSNPLYNRMESELARLRVIGNLRSLPMAEFRLRHAVCGDRQMLNLSSNDYLGLASDLALRQEFFETVSLENFIPTSSSSRLLTGNSEAYSRLEGSLKRLYNSEGALVFGSGYHANTGILPAIAGRDTEIFADKLVHASLIDGIRLSEAHYCRFRHNDLAELRRMLAESSEKNPDIVRIIVTESIFSMDGDTADLRALVAIKNEFPNVLLYVDEAHAVGVRGPSGLGLAEETGTLGDIDFLVGTFGKALASTGAFVVTSRLVCEWLVNKMRTLIFTTALPPVNLSWSNFILERLPAFGDRRARLLESGKRVADAVRGMGCACPSSSPIVPWIIGSSADTIACAQRLRDAGYYALPVRPPTVPEGTSRIRFSLTAAILPEEISTLVTTLAKHDHCCEVQEPKVKKDYDYD